MSYKKSRARREFERNVAQALVELAPLHKRARQLGGDAASRLLGAYYVFSFAQFEVYVKSIAEDTVGAIASSTPRLSKWPDSMFTYLLHRTGGLAEGYRKYSWDEDEGAILSKVTQVARNVASWGSADAVGVPINAAHYLDRKTYPSPKNFPKLFRRLGIHDIWAVIGRAGKMNGELQLKSLNDLRTGIAHEGHVPVGFAMPDFRNKIEQMKRVVQALDRGVASQFCGTSLTRSSWNAAVV